MSKNRTKEKKRGSIDDDGSITQTPTTTTTTVITINNHKIFSVVVYTYRTHYYYYCYYYYYYLFFAVCKYSIANVVHFVYIVLPPLLLSSRTITTQTYIRQFSVWYTILNSLHRR